MYKNISNANANEGFPIAGKLSKTAINLPSYPDLTLENVAEIAESII